jgi:iron-sulfur cluster assembly accessory protein
MNNIIKITKNAGTKLIQIAKQNETKSLLFYVKGGGCNGFNYKFKPLHEEPCKLDEVVPYRNINVVVCGKSMLYLMGTTIDWKNDIMGESFHFENPNAGAKCGCGTSFSPKI